jgi:trimeric autotransporter adhesin
MLYSPAAARRKRARLDSRGYSAQLRPARDRTSEDRLVRRASGGQDMPVFTGTPGNDSINGSNSDDQITGLGGNDSIRGNDGNDMIDGGDDDDFMRGHDGNDVILGGNGHDYLDGGLGDDILDGGSGLDRVSFAVDATVGISVDLNMQGVAQTTGHGDDTLIGIEHISGTRFNDVIVGDSADNWLWGGSDSSGVTGDDTISGNDGNDLITVGTGNHNLSGGSGTDTLGTTNDTDITAAGMTVSLALQGAPQATGQGSWTLSGFENLSGSHQNDHLTGDGIANILAGHLGSDTLSGGAGNDTLYGDGNLTVLTSNGGSGPFITYTDYSSIDPMTLIPGNDTLEGGEGDDLLDGGGGTDTASYANASGDVQVFLSNLGNGSSSGADGEDTLTSIENVTGSAHDDHITGNNFDNVLSGGGGHDQLRGNGGNDSLLGGDGHDFLAGGDGDDILDGGAGLDRTSFFTGATAGVTVDLNIQGVAQNTGRGMDTLIGIEHTSGTAFDDVLIGNGGDNWLWGDPTGNDTISGNGGNDLIWAGVGNHTVSGGSGTDTLGSNTTDLPSGVTWSLALQGAPQATAHGTIDVSGIENLSGTEHSDSLTGDGGDNVLAGALGNDTLAGGDGNDTLYGDGAITIEINGNGGSGPIVTYADFSTVFGDVPGDDTLEGGLGNDQLFGGGGTDTASYAGASGAVFVNLTTGNASGAAGFDTLNGIENVTGSAFDDNLRGDAGANVLAGGLGHDFMRGLDGNDTLLGGDGNDYLDGGLGDDSFDGGAGFDRISFAVNALNGVTVDLNVAGPQATGHGTDSISGVEHLSGTKFSDVITGDGGDNWLWGGSDSSGVTGDDTISGNGGNDLITVGNGNHILSGGSGTDTLGTTNDADITAAGMTVSLALQGAAQATGQGSWTLSGFENLSGSHQNDHLTGDGLANILAGHLGNDMLSGGGGDDTLYGDGAITVQNNNGGSGPIVTYGDYQLLDPLTLVSGNDTLDGGDGNDTIDGGGGTDTASYASATGGVTVTLNNLGNGSSSGAAGNDTLVSIENLSGSSFDDTIFGNDSANVLSGGDGHDFMRGRLGNDSMSGGNGDDYLDGGDGDDAIDGGAGTDRASFAVGATAGVTVDLNIVGVAQNTGRGMDTLTGIEQVTGTDFADTLTGDGADNWLWGLNGNDVISAGGGNDLVQVVTGNHVAAGGSGNDTLSVHDNGTGAAAAGVTVSLALQGVAQATGLGSKTLTGFENLSGSAYNDTLTGDGAANVLAGSLGDDNLSGGDGADRLYGDGQYNPTRQTGGGGPIVLHTDIAALFAEPAGNDTLNGGKGDDVLMGGGGDDILTGGADDDLFLFGNGSGDDVITDMSKKDTIGIVGVAGVDSFGDLNIVNVGGNAVVSWGTTDSITLNGMKANKVTASMFVFEDPTAPAAAMASSNFAGGDMLTPPEYWG